jgi:hypothetical protein
VNTVPLRRDNPDDLIVTLDCGTRPRWHRPLRHVGGTPGRACRFGSNEEAIMIRKLKSGQYRLYSKKTDPKTGKRRNLGTFDTREAAEKHEREVQFFKRH